MSASGGSEGSSGSGEPGSFLVYLDPSIWTEPKPLAACYPPCTLVFPPFELPQPTTITFKPITTGLAIVSAAGSKVTSYTNTLVNTVYVTTITLYNTKISTTTIVVPPGASKYIEDEETLLFGDTLTYKLNTWLTKSRCSYHQNYQLLECDNQSRFTLTGSTNPEHSTSGHDDCWGICTADLSPTSLAN